MKPILLFDIDGTLINIKKSFTRELIAEICKELNINPLEIKKYSFAGRTDRDIFYDFVSHHPESENLYIKVKELYLSLMKNHFSDEHADIIDGALEAVQFARENDLETGLCTGNFRESAYYKVEAVGLKGMFEFGGFGCNHEDRKHLPAEAHHDFVKTKGYEPEPGQYIIIGDTPNDIQSAKYFGARSVSVSTGTFGKDELQKHNPDLLIENLTQMIDWMHQTNSI
jgi:phosphoglycolate phosphatase